MTCVGFGAEWEFDDVLRAQKNGTYRRANHHAIVSHRALDQSPPFAALHRCPVGAATRRSFDLATAGKRIAHSPTRGRLQRWSSSRDHTSRLITRGQPQTTCM